MADLASQVSKVVGDREIPAKDVKVDSLVWISSLSGWRRIITRDIEGLRVIWALSGGGWAQRSVDELVTVKAENICPTCRGAGEISRQHPSYGSSSCPSPTIEETCPTCGGSGRGW